MSLDEFVKTPVTYTKQEDEAARGVKTTFGKYGKKCTLCAAVLLIVYMILIPLIASIVIGGEPLKLDKIEMFGLIAGTQSIRVTTQLQLSKSLPRNCELPSPIFTVNYKNQPLGRIISDGALITSNDGRMNAVNSSFAITSVSTLHTMGRT